MDAGFCRKQVGTTKQELYSEGDGKEGVIFLIKSCKYRNRKLLPACGFVCCGDRMKVINLNLTG